MPSTDTGAPTPSTGGSLRDRLVAWVREFVQFGLVGALSFVIDSGLFNLLQYGPGHLLHGHANTANVISAAVATCFSWVANRVWTYRGRTQENVAREALLFAFANVGGILITQFCLLFTHHVLGLTSQLADNIAAYVVGFALGTAFRFLFYHYIVFTGTKDVATSEGALTAAVVGGVPATEPAAERAAEPETERPAHPEPQRAAETGREPETAWSAVPEPKPEPAAVPERGRPADPAPRTSAGRA